MSHLSEHPLPTPRWMIANSTREVFLAVCVGPLVCGSIAGGLVRWLLLSDALASLVWASVLLLLTVFGACGPVLWAGHHVSEDLARFAVRRGEGVLHTALALLGAVSMMLAAYTAAAGPNAWSWALAANPVLVGAVGSLAASRAEPRRPVRFAEADAEVLVRRCRRVGAALGVLVGVALGARAAGWFGACAGAYCGTSIGLASGRGVAELVTTPRARWARRGDAMGSIGFGVGAAAGAVVAGLVWPPALGAPPWVAILSGFLLGGLVVGGGTALLAGGAVRWPAARAVLPTVGFAAGLLVAMGLGVASGSDVVAAVTAPLAGAVGCAWALFVIADF